MGDLTANLSRSEFACKDGCGFDTVDIRTVTVVQDVRDHFNASLTVNSGCRCPARNKVVGGEPDSQHMKARAADIRVAGVDPSLVADYLERKYPGKYGIGRYKTFTHIDTRSNGPARWRG